MTDSTWVLVAGIGSRVELFAAIRRKAIHRIYPTQGQEPFLQGHIEAFEAIGGVPTRHIKYDNLTCAVAAVLHGRDRQRDENARWVLFRSHDGFDQALTPARPAGAVVPMVAG